MADRMIGGDFGLRQLNFTQSCNARFLPATTDKLDAHIGYTCSLSYVNVKATKYSAGCLSIGCEQHVLPL